MSHILLTLKSLKSASVIAAILIALATLLVFLPAVDNGFVSWDDATNLVDNPYFRGFTKVHLKWIWTNHLLSHYVPLTWMSFALDYRIWGREARGYHLTNVLLHSFNAGLFYLLSLTLLRRCVPTKAFSSTGALLPGAVFAALLFSLHPLRVESVAWVTERRDVLSGFFLLLALLAYLRASAPGPAQPTQSKYYLACFAFFVLAILSKEIAVVLPAILLLLDVYPLKRLGGGAGRWFGPSVRWVWLEKIPFFAVALADAAMTLHVGAQQNLLPSVGKFGWIPRIAITVYAMAFYLLKTLIPTNLSPLYPLTPHNTGLTVPVAISLAVVLSTTFAAIVLRRRFPALLVIWLSFAVTLLPVSGIFQAGAQVAADRYTYLSCMGWALLAGAAFAWCWHALDSSWGRGLIALVGLLVLVTLSGLTRAQIRIWQDSDTLWSRAVSVEPSAVACENLGSSLFTEGDVVGAMDQFRQAIALKPQDAIAHVGMGMALLDLRRWDEAAGELRLASELMPSLAQAHNGLGNILAVQGKIDEAIAEFQQAVTIRPDNRIFQKNLERALAMKVHPEQRNAWDASRQPR
jgi:tetratricopeptide (TPR) repeat protein